MATFVLVNRIETGKKRVEGLVIKRHTDAVQCPRWSELLSQ